MTKLTHEQLVETGVIKTLPHLSNLEHNQQLLEVIDYYEHNDSFICLVHTGAPGIGQECEIPACLIPKLTGEYGEPDEFIGRTFLVQA